MGVMRTLVIILFALVEIIVAGCAGEEGAAALVARAGGSYPQDPQRGGEYRGWSR